ncbi:hypothetical protein PQ610_00800 [Tardisphaera miroshnichenkoae]
MKNEAMALVLLGLVLWAGSLYRVVAQGAGETTLEVVVMNYNTKAPVPLLPLRFSVGSISYSGTTSYNGSVEVKLASSAIQPLRELAIGDNYSLVMVGSSEAVSYSLPYGAYSTSVNYLGYYANGFCHYESSFLPSSVQLNGKAVQQVTMWVLPGKAVNVNTFDLNTGSSDEAVLSPGLPVEGSSQFFVPVGFPITVTAVTQQGELGPAFTVTLNSTDTWINWSSLYFSYYINSNFAELSSKVKYYAGAGFTSSEYYYEQLLPLYESSLFYLKQGNYSLALLSFSQAKRIASRISSSFSSFLETAWAVTLTVLILIYAVSLMAASPLSRKLGRRSSKFSPLLFYLPLSVLLALTQPYTYSALASLFDLPIPPSPLQSAALALVVFSLLYVLFALAKKAADSTRPSFTSRIAMENLKSRFGRALLVIIPIAIVVGSSMSLVSFSAQLGMVRLGGGTYAAPPGAPKAFLGVVIKKGTSDADTAWLPSQPWVNGTQSISYVPSKLTVGANAFSLVSVEVVSAGQTDFLKGLYGVSPGAWPYLNLNASGGSLPAAGEPQVLLPAGLPGVYLGSTVNLVLLVSPASSPGTVMNYSLGDFTVSGFYEPRRSSTPPYMGSFDGAAFLSYPSQVMTAKYLFFTVKRGYNVASLATRVASLTGLTTIAASNGTWEEYALTYLLGVTHGSVAVGPVVMSAILAYSFTSLFVEERKRDITLMSTLGATPSFLAQIFVLQIAALGVLSVTLGVFGSYAMNAFEGLFGHSAGAANAWSLNALLIGLFIGLVVPLLAALLAINSIPESKIVGGPKKRVIPKEARIENGSAVYALPLRIGVDETDLFSQYLRENVVPKLKGLNPQLAISEAGMITLRVDAHWRMETSSPETVTVRSQIQSGIMYFELSYDPSLSDDREFQEFLYKLERTLLAYPVWRDKNVKVFITRKAVEHGKISVERAEKGVDELITEISQVKGDVEQYNKKLDQLVSMKGEISPAVYAEFEKRYKKAISDSLSRLKPYLERAQSLRENLRRDLNDDLRKLADLEASKKLGEISDENYTNRKASLEREIGDLRQKVSLLEWAIAQLSAPS